MNTKLALATLIAALAAPLAVQAAGDPGAGQTKAAACAGCHGADGNSPAPNFPKLAGQHATYIVKELRDFKSGARKDPVMSPQVLALSDQDMEDIAAWFESRTPAGGSADEALVARGEALFRAGNASSGVSACAACHGPAGTGNAPARFPRLAGQHAQYTVKQLQDFARGTRSNDAGKMMRNIAARMKPAEIEAVASYIQGLH